jgi:hypothetical protein
MDYQRKLLERLGIPARRLQILVPENAVCRQQDPNLRVEDFKPLTLRIIFACVRTDSLATCH